jgi:DNA-binding GntR family transcriptional regulator
MLDILHRPPSLKDMAFQAIKRAILEDKLLPEKIYKIEELAKYLGISRTPVREALQDLSSLRFVSILPRRGIRVNVLDEKDIQDLYEFRAAIESAIIRHIAPTISDEDIERAQTINNQALACGSEERMAYLRKDREFHRFLSELSENDYLTDALEHVRDLVDWMGIKALTKEDRMIEVCQEHDRVLEMLRKSDTEGAATMMVEHVVITRQVVLRQFKERWK